MERPIIFSSEMFRAILDGKKTQTRRVCKPANQNNLTSVVSIDKHGCIPTTDASIHAFGDKEGTVEFNSPYGKVGDVLWVRESAIIAPKNFNDGTPRLVKYIATSPDREQSDEYKLAVTPSIFMPRWASRILLEITSVAVERLQSISDEDCISEGCYGGHNSIPNYGYSATPREHYFAVWEKINGKGSSHENPWVWVIKFKVLKI